jgi:putative membrane protein
MSEEPNITYDFSAPRKQSSSGIIIMFANSFQKVVRALALPLILIIVKSKDSGNLALILIAFLCLLTIILALFAYFSYQKFTFFLDEKRQEFIINSGIFSKTSLTIQLNKIQQVNINQNLLQQFFGVYSLEIDTAGSEKKEASIKAIDHATATVLKQKLLSRDLSENETSNIQADNQIAEATPPLLKLSTNTLLKIGITTNYGASLLLLTGFIFGAFQLFKDYTDALEIERVAFALIIILATNIIRTFVKYFNFKIIKQKGALAVSSGLFTHKNVLLTPNKVQLSAYSQNYFQKKFDLLNMKIKQASFDSADKEDSKKSDIEIPGCSETERNEVLKMILSRAPTKGAELKPNYRFIFLQTMIWIVFPISVFALLSIYALPLLRNYLFMVVPYIIVVGTMLYFEFKRHRLYVDEHFIIKKSGIWDVEHEIIEPHKIQAITAKQYFWHKTADVGHLIIHTAAGVIHFKYGNYTHIKSLVNYWTYKIEVSKKDWM